MLNEQCVMTMNCLNWHLLVIVGRRRERESLLKHVKCLLICIFIEIDLNKMYFNALTYI